MAKPPKKTAIGAKDNAPDIQVVEIDPDAWPKFEALVKSAAKMGPKPHATVTHKPNTKAK